MSRGLTSGMLVAIAAGNTYPVLFGFFDFLGGAIYVCTHGQTLTWNGHDWVGLGTFVGVEAIKETQSTQANGLNFSLNGIPSTLLSGVLLLRSRGRTCRLFKGFFDTSGNVIADPVQSFAGRMDQPQINDEGTTSNISLSAESVLVDLQRPRERRYTDGDQQAYFPGDTFLQYVASLQGKEVIWGPTNSSTPSSKTTRTSDGFPAGGNRYGGGFGGAVIPQIPSEIPQPPSSPTSY